MFKNAIVRRPCPEMVNGLTPYSALGLPDYDKALKQHSYYISVLEQCGLNVKILEADSRFPDSCFVEDVAVLSEKAAVVTNPEADSRKEEKDTIVSVLGEFYSESSIHFISECGTVEGGDVMRVEDHFYIGTSSRTDRNGAEQLISVLEKYGFTGSCIPVKSILHLKTGISYLDNGMMIMLKEFVSMSQFDRFEKITVDPSEKPSANCLFINGKVIVHAGYPKTLKSLKLCGYDTVEVDISEFEKLDGGLTCLSLRF